MTLTHENAASFVSWCAEVFEPHPDDTFSSHAPFHFDLSILDLFVPLTHGARLVGLAFLQCGGGICKNGGGLAVPGILIENTARGVDRRFPLPLVEQPARGGQGLGERKPLAGLGHALENHGSLGFLRKLLKHPPGGGLRLVDISQEVTALRVQMDRMAGDGFDGRRPVT